MDRPIHPTLVGKTREQIDKIAKPWIKEIQQQLAEKPDGALEQLLNNHIIPLTPLGIRHISTWLYDNETSYPESEKQTLTQWLSKLIRPEKRKPSLIS